MRSLQLPLYLLCALPLFFLGDIVNNLINGYAASYLPGYFAGFLAATGLGIIFIIRDRAMVVLSLVWIIWYVVGVLNTVSSSLFLGGYYSNLDVNLAAIIYLSGAIFFLLGIKSGEVVCERVHISGLVSMTIKSTINKPVKLLLVFFPVAWLASMYFYLGYIPMLLGINIVDEMYELNYGPLYPYTAIISISCVFAMKKIIFDDGGVFWWVIFILGLIISFSDGKRVIVMIVCGAIVPMVFSRYGQSGWVKIISSMLMMILFYVIGEILRQGGSTDRYESDKITKYMAVGVEFRDFVYSVNILTAGEVDGFNWHKSAVAAFMNSGVLSIFGIDKKEYVMMGSAYVWSKIFNSEFGIRTGLLSELWFAYSYLYLFFLFLAGMMSSCISFLVKHVGSEMISVLLWCTMGLGYLAVVGQTTAITGTLTVYAYVYLIYIGSNWIFGVKK
jgi:hypothetical protein